MKGHESTTKDILGNLGKTKRVPMPLVGDAWRFFSGDVLTAVLGIGAHINLLLVRRRRQCSVACANGSLATAR